MHELEFAFQAFSYQSFMVGSTLKLVFEAEPGYSERLHSRRIGSLSLKQSSETYNLNLNVDEHVVRVGFWFDK